MITNVEKYIARAEDDLESSKLLFDANMFSGSIDRSYFAMFYCARGMLAMRQTFVRKNKNMLRQFSQIFIKTAEIDTNFAKQFKATCKLRKRSVFNINHDTTREETATTLNHAAAFIEMTRIYLNQQTQ